MTIENLKLLDMTVTTLSHSDSDVFSWKLDIFFNRKITDAEFCDATQCLQEAIDNVKNQLENMRQDNE